MPRLVRSVPKYSKHRASGQAVVTLSGQDFYLGPHGTKASKLEYDRQIAEWLARGRRPLTDSADDQASVIELIVAYMDHAKLYYRKDGKPTSEVAAIHSAAKVLQQFYGRELANDFDALKLQAVQQAMIRLGWSRGCINKQVQRIVRMFGWGVSRKLVVASVVAELREVPGLHKGRSAARETDPVRPVEESTLQATLHHLPAVVADMVRLQRLTGCRPDEICQVRPCDVDTSGEVWAYRPRSHKTEHHGRERVIFIGPKGQDILRPYLLRDKASYCFCPAESERKRREAAHEARTTPLGCGNRPGTNKAAKPQRAAGKRYDTAAYRRAIARACEIAFGMPDQLRKKPKNESPEAKADRLAAAEKWRAENVWAPNRLRHSLATEVRSKFGAEAAQVVLGHSNLSTTEIYAEKNMATASKVMALVG